MKRGLDGLLEHGIDRAGIGGIPQLIGENFMPQTWNQGRFGVGVFGPSVSQVVEGVTRPMDRTLLGSLPAGSIARRLAG
jgi:hypothetical protein